MSLRIRRGLEAQRVGITFDMGEPIWVTNTEKLYVGDGITPGGKSIIAQYAGTGLQYNAIDDTLEIELLSFNTDQITEGSNHKYFTVQRAQDAAASLFTGGSNVGISYTYDDVLHKVNSTVNIGTEVIQDAVAPLFIDGIHSGITFAYDDNTNRINATVSVNEEYIQDSIANMLLNGTHTNIFLQYNDNLNTFDISSTFQVVDDTSPSLGGDLDLNTHNITGVGDIDIGGSVRSLGDGNFGQIVTGEGTISSTNTIKLDGNNTLIYSPTDGTLANPGILSIDSYKGTTASPINLSQDDVGSAVLFRNYFNDDYQFSSILYTQINSDAVYDTNGVPGVPSSINLIVKKAGGTGISSYSFGSDGAFSTSSIRVGDGTENAPSIVFSTDGGVDTGFYHPQDGVIVVSTNAVEHARFDSGGIRTTGFLKAGSFNGSGAYPSPPEAGMIVFDSSNNHFYGYDGTTWKQLDN